MEFIDIKNYKWCETYAFRKKKMILSQSDQLKKFNTEKIILNYFFFQ